MKREIAFDRMTDLELGRYMHAKLLLLERCLTAGIGRTEMLNIQRQMYACERERRDRLRLMELDL